MGGKNDDDAFRPVSWPKGSPAAELYARPFTSMSDNVLDTPSQKANSYPTILTSQSLSSSLDTRNSWASQLLLSLDGGGIRGLASLLMLKYLMQHVADVERSREEQCSCSKDSPLLHFRDLGSVNLSSHVTSRVKGLEKVYLPCHYFDFIGGTSTGGLNAVMLGRLQLSVNQTIERFRKIWKVMAYQELHSGPFWKLGRRKTSRSNTKGLDIALRDILSGWRENKISWIVQNCDTFYNLEDIQLDEELRSDRLVLATEVTSDSMQQAHIFSSYRSKEKDQSQNEGISIVDACKATSAAPKYFKTAMIGGKRYRDGSILTTNPSVDFIEEIRSYQDALYEESNEKHRLAVIISIGCGSDLKRTRSKKETAEELPGKKLAGAEFIRLPGPDDLPEYDLNLWRADPLGDKTFKEIEQRTTRYCEANYDLFRRAAKTLVKYRRDRSKTSFWERYAFGIRYRCRLCREENRDFEEREDLIEHLQKEHNQPPPHPSNWNQIQTLLQDSQIIGDSRW